MFTRAIDQQWKDQGRERTGRARAALVWHYERVTSHRTVFHGKSAGQAGDSIMGWADVDSVSDQWFPKDLRICKVLMNASVPTLIPGRLFL